jgi:hypothetical protein
MGLRADFGPSGTLKRQMIWVIAVQRVNKHVLAAYTKV